MTPFTDSQGRIWPEETILSYQRDAKHWSEFARQLDELSEVFASTGRPTSALRARLTAQDIRKALEWKQ